MIARSGGRPSGRPSAASPSPLGGAGFAIANDDAMSMVVTVVATPLLAVGFPRAPRRGDAARAVARRRPAWRRSSAHVAMRRPVGPHDRRRADRGLAVERRRDARVRPRPRRPGHRRRVPWHHGRGLAAAGWPGALHPDRGGLPLTMNALVAVIAAIVVIV